MTTVFKHDILLKIPYLDKIPFLNKLLPSKNPTKDGSVDGSKALTIAGSGQPTKGSLPAGTKAALASLTGGGGVSGFISKLNPLNWKIANKEEIAEQEDNEKYQAGEPYGDPRVLSISLYKELRSIGVRVKPHHIQTLIQVLKSKTKLIDDRQMTVSIFPMLVLHIPLIQEPDGEDDCDNRSTTENFKSAQQAYGYHYQFFVVQSTAPALELPWQQISVQNTGR